MTAFFHVYNFNIEHATSNLILPTHLEQLMGTPERCYAPLFNLRHHLDLNQPHPEGEHCINIRDDVSGVL